VTVAFQNDAEAISVLRATGLSSSRIPQNFTTDPDQAWLRVFRYFDLGAIRDPYRDLLAAVLHVYPYHDVLRPIAERHRIVAPEEVRAELAPEPEPEPEPEATEQEPARPPRVTPAAAPTGPTCHVIVRTEDEPSRLHAESVLTGLGLDPVQMWATATAASLRVNATDAAALEQRLDQDATDIGWTVVAPGQPDYLLQTLIVEGPDGRRFRVRDVPAQESISNMAREVVESQYPRPSGSRTLPITVDHVRDGQPQRVDGDSTFDEAQIRDGDTVRVGYQTNAGSVNPDEHQAALFRARNQIDAFASSHPGFGVRANSAQLPTEYELSFTQRSLGPAERMGDDPVPIDDHVVLLQLGPDFPRTPPMLWWESPIFHPNVSPNYGDARVRRPQTAGLVCLGILAESWQPSWSFGDLCQMVIDMAAYRSYGLWEQVGWNDDGTPRRKGDFYDADAAEWVQRNQHVIEALGGVVKTVALPQRLHYPHVIEALDADTGPDR
jgi:hypothetical protein